MSAFDTWEYVIAPTPREGAQPALRRIAVPGGWLYQVESYELLSGSKVVSRCWQPPVFVAEGPTVSIAEERVP